MMRRHCPDTPLTFSLQALLVRHEAYMVDAERERLSMSATIEKLEQDKRNMEVANAKTAEENRNLLDQLDDLTNSVADSDAHIKSLSATLQSTQQELQRLSALAAKTAQLESQLVDLEQERADLQQSLTTTEEEEKSALQRWRTAERTLADLQDQMERIESEAYEERARHVEIVARLERRRAVEKELDGAAGRLKGAAAAATVGKGRDGGNVVSHFVKDILQDNGNLQMGIVELREMLTNSNEEVQHLREQLMLHQPVGNDEIHHPRSLREELSLDQPPTISQELHVHHHYHAVERANANVKDKALPRRTKKKRNISSSGIFTPPSGLHTPSMPHPRHVRPALPALSTAGAVLSQTSLSVPAASQAMPATANRWSFQSNQTQASSVLSSPQSIYHQSAIFDRDNVMDSSRPTSPESNDATSPLFTPRHRARDSDASMRSFTAPTPLQITAPPPTIATLHPTAEIDSDDGADTDTYNMPKLHEDDEHEQRGHAGPRLRRSASHESLVSVSGMDIHTLRSRPSQLTLIGRASTSNLRGPGSRAVSSPLATSSVAVLGATTTTATARPLLASRRYDSRAYNHSLLQATRQRPGTDAVSDGSGSGFDALGKRVGGWVWSRWATSPSGPSTGLSPSPSASPPSTQNTLGAHQALPCTTSPSAALAPLNLNPFSIISQQQQQRHPLDYFGRSPGVNQSGPIKGFMGAGAERRRRAAAAARTRVTLSEVDEELLAETLREGDE